jgi:D-serine deaminase-like pyridoxal phosphate-dependent protein
LRLAAAGRHTAHLGFLVQHEIHFAGRPVHFNVRDIAPEFCVEFAGVNQFQEGRFRVYVIHAASMSGVTEIRPGVYTLFDLAQVALRSCTVEDVAVSVLATVIGHNPRAERVLIDAGALALSKDLSGNKRGATVGYGLVCGASGDRPADRLHVADVHQEHGLVAGPRPHEELVEAYPVGARVRILPNHACLTAAPHDRYYVVRGRDTSILDVWPKASGWSGDPPA